MNLDYSYVLFFIIAELPIIVATLVMGWIFIDVFLPNPRLSKGKFSWGKIISWFLAEILEHVILPVTIIFSASLIPTMTVAFLFLFTMIVFGKILGNAKNISQWIDVFMIFIGLLFIFLLPYLTSYWQFRFELPGWLLLSLVTLLSLIFYIKFKTNEKKHLNNRNIND